MNWQLVVNILAPLLVWAAAWGVFRQRLMEVATRMREREDTDRDHDSRLRQLENDMAVHKNDNSHFSKAIDELKAEFKTSFKDLETRLLEELNRMRQS